MKAVSETLRTAAEFTTPLRVAIVRTHRGRGVSFKELARRLHTTPETIRYICLGWASQAPVALPPPRAWRPIVPRPCCACETMFLSRYRVRRTCGKPECIKTAIAQTRAERYREAFAQRVARRQG